MGDFLGQLIARSLDRADVMCPRLTGLFEPSQPGGDLAAPDGEPTDSATPAPIPAAPSLQRLAIQPQPVSPVPPEAAARVRPRSRPDTPASPPAAMALHSNPPRVVNEPPATAAETPRPLPVQPHPTSTQPRERVRDAPTVMERTLLQPVSRKAVVERVAPHSPAAPTEVEQTLLQPVVERLIETSRQPATPPRTVTPARPPEVPDARPAADVLRPAPHVEASGVVQSPVERAGRQAAAPPPTASPTIHVTIGRVEVRASSSEQPARRTSPQPQVMSLDEYLKQRGSGGRR